MKYIVEICHTAKYISTRVCVPPRMSRGFARVLGILLMVGSTLAGVCQDGILDADEGCDDGNRYSGDGCDRLCRIEDPSQDVWLCSTVANVKSVCCPTLVNPVSLEKVCDCRGAAQPSASWGFTITPTCTKRDIDECNVAGLCNDKATCMNQDGTQSNNTHSFTYMCECPTGWNGDGVTTCDIHTYQTNFKIVDFDVVSVDSSVVIQELKDSVTVPADVSIDRISTTVGPYYGGPLASRRFVGSVTGKNSYQKSKVLFNVFNIIFNVGNITEYILMSVISVDYHPHIIYFNVGNIR
jgi:cysteine-rich repeat protein